MELRLIEDIQFCETASDNTGYALAYADGLYCLTNSKGQIICEFLRQQPSIGPLHALGACYCRECKKFYPDADFCGQHQSAMKSTDFCSYGIPKEQGATE